MGTLATPACDAKMRPPARECPCVCGHTCAFCQRVECFHGWIAEDERACYLSAEHEGGHRYQWDGQCGWFYRGLS